MSWVRKRILGSDNCIHTSLEPAGKEYREWSKKRGSNSFKFFTPAVRILVVATIKDAEGNLQAVVGMDENDKEHQLWP